MRVFQAAGAGIMFWAAMKLLYGPEAELVAGHAVPGRRTGGGCKSNDVPGLLHHEAVEQEQYSLERVPAAETAAE